MSNEMQKDFKTMGFCPFVKGLLKTLLVCVCMHSYYLCDRGVKFRQQLMECAQTTVLANHQYNPGPNIKQLKLERKKGINRGNGE